MPIDFTIAHLSDVHLSPVVGFTPEYWNAKRLLGFVNWQRKRRFVHQRAVADRIAADMRAKSPDHIVLTGDLINIGLPAEYEAAAAWLRSIGPPSDVSLVPGNHDIYTAIGRDPGSRRWAAYMTSDPWGRQISETGAETGDGHFPYVRRVGPIAIVGLCSAVETAPGIATGRLGPTQMAAACRILKRLALDPVFRLVMIHHPPLPGMTRAHHELTDAPELAQVLASAGAELVLHGHTHLATVTSVTRGSGTVPVVGVGSASAAIQHRGDPMAQYSLLRVTGAPGAWRLHLTRRGFSGRTDGIIELETRVLV
jgi:3',5'-cyclic AMP phosphodiesterase CpdA